MEELKKLTAELAQQEVKKITECSSDDEVAHSYEDELHFWFIQCVAAKMYENNEAVEVANIVKSTSEISFCRWCA